MLVSLSWLKKYVDIPTDTKTLCDDLTMAGLNVERVIPTGLTEEKIVVGRVLEVGPHPNADKLVVCRVDVGGEAPSEIVCGAPNVAAGQLVSVALVGAVLPNGMKIRSSTIRGALSEGMICSEAELGLGADAAGIMVLEGDFTIGVPLSDEVFPPDDVLEIEVTPNRPDQLSHVVIAREVAAVYRVPFTVPEATIAAGRPEAKPGFEIEIADPADCRRYVGIRVKGVRVGPSPAWLANSLRAVGLNTINSIVDVANYVMLELGQPLHGFDLNRVRGRHIIVRRAGDNEKLLALDGNTYELTPDMLVIADEKAPVALGGIIGGEESGVGQPTEDILIESANFEPRLVRTGRKALGITTDASYRFERGVDRELCRRAAERAVSLIIEIAGGEVQGMVDVYPKRHVPRMITIRQSQTRRLLGSSITTRDIGDSLNRLGFRMERTSADELVAEVPSYRVDVFEEADLIEEAARIYGYERIGSGWEFRTTTFAVPDYFDRYMESLSDHLASRGFTEVLTSSFTDGKELEDFGWADDDPRHSLVPVRNPLTANQNFMRTSLVPGMLDVIRRNFDQGTRRIRVFQVGPAYFSPEGPNKLPDERILLTVAATNPAVVDFWYNSKQAVDL
ncbi:MAG: phenylalanine--tRNA ligase subunit beta, partial [Deltaproteobacteria bacterium]|nr:phenylalanine--tRNA ligase subunit beta [Deltaproteobacteria bacterium]